MRDTRLRKYRRRSMTRATTAVRHRRHPRHGEYRPDDRRNGAPAGPGRRAAVHPRRHRHRVVIGKDTRLSGYMIEPALTAGFIGAGMDVTLVGPLPTPAIAMLTRSLRADLGVMISASHNPFEDNGIKLFGPDGFKLSRRDRARDRGADGQTDIGRPAGRARHARARLAAGRRRRPLYRGGEGELPARAAAGRT